MFICVHSEPRFFRIAIIGDWKHYDAAADFCDYLKRKYPKLKAHIVVPKWEKKK